MTVAVTGADGFAGSHLVDVLSRSQKVVACVRATPLKNLVPNSNVRTAFVDVLDPTSLSSAFWGCDRVYHLAAVSGISEARAKPRVTDMVNVTGTHNVILACLDQGVKRMLYASTCHVAGSDVYAASKRAAEDICSAYRKKLEIVVTRAFNHYGPRQRPEWVVPDFIDKALRGEPIVVNSPSAVRDFTYVLDVANGYRVAMEKAEPFEPVEIGSGQGITMKRLALVIARLAEYAGKIEYGMPRTNDVDEMVADPSGAEALGWKPTVELELGLRWTMEWYRRRLGSAK